jgi:hypothetical protein
MLRNKIAINIALISLWGILCAFLGSTISSLAVADDAKNQIKTKKLSIIDDQGRERIVLGMEDNKIGAYFVRGDGKKSIQIVIDGKKSGIYIGYPQLHYGKDKRGKHIKTRGEGLVYISAYEDKAIFHIMQRAKGFNGLLFGVESGLNPYLVYGTRGLVKFMGTEEDNTSIRFFPNIESKASLDFNFGGSGPKMDLRDDIGEPVVRISIKGKEPIKKLK